MVETWRGGIVESSHRVRVAVSDPDGRLRAAAGDVAGAVFARSAVKPLQALPLVEDGGIERFEMSSAELALCCASHGGEPVHVQTVARLLERIGAEEDDLVCGPHPPMHAASAAVLQREGVAPGRLHNNCSGNHTGMLALARLHGWPLAGYERPEHPVQRRMLASIAEWADLPADEVGTAIDGCGVVTFALPLERLAAAFARLAAAYRAGPRGTGSPAARIVDAMLRCPEMVAGQERLCTALMQISQGRIFAKVGAEGVYCAGVPGAELGIALKVEDGASRAAEPALLGVLRALGVLTAEQMAEAATWAEPDLLNTRGDRVGRIRARVELEAQGG